LKAGDTIPVRIDALDLEERKITLAPSEGQDATDWKSFSGKGQDAQTPSGLGVLGQKLQEAIKSGK